MRLIIRLIAYCILAAGVIVAVVDATRSVAAGAATYTTLADALTAAGHDAGTTGEAVTQWLEQTLPADQSREIVSRALAIPAAALAAAAFLILYVAGARRRQR